jgi:mono/diheme cytochrome c family protein
MSTGNRILIVSLAALLASGCSTEKRTGFITDVKPILDNYCAECHTPGGAGTLESGFLVDSYASVMQGTKYGPVVEPGSAESSSLYRLIAGKVDPSIRMPHGDRQMTGEEIETIRLWIDQGAGEG